MAGAIAIVLIIVIGLPVVLMVSGTIVAALIGWTATEDAKTRHDGSELIDLS